MNQVQNPNISDSWKNLLKYHYDHIQTNNVDVFKEEDLNSDKRTLSLIFKLPEDSAIRVNEHLKAVIPNNLQKKIYFPSPSAYHFTIQWAPDEFRDQMVNDEVFNELTEILSNFKPIQGVLFYPYLGRANLFGMLRTTSDEGFSKIRSSVYEIWDKRKVPNGIKPYDFEIAWVSLVRFTDSLTEDEIRTLSDLDIEEQKEVVLSEVQLVRNDKFNTPEKTDIICTVHLTS